MNGLSLGDFPTHDEALKCADDLVAANAKEYEHKVSPQINASNPLLTKHWYVHGQGTKRKYTQAEEKALSGDSDLKTRKQLADSQAFMEGLGPSSSAEGQVKIENVAFTDMTQSREKCRSHDILRRPPLKEASLYKKQT